MIANNELDARFCSTHQQASLPNLCVCAMRKVLQHLLVDEYTKGKRLQ